MARKPQPTLADYIVIALSPALIMLLVGSLVFFLIEVFYGGDFHSRLNFIMAMFVMAIVLIARISIEESRGYAALFAIPLAGLTGIALYRFVEFGGPLQSFSMFINIGLLGLIWWCADRLTWDSTVIDESQDASGEGLLQTAGLDGEATTQNPGPIQDPAVPSHQSLWQRFLANRRKAHSPGVWVIYFSIAALPIFGLGHWFVPAEDTGSRRYVFKLLVIYVGSGLGLLLTTSFLNLRRYLRQRRLEMPVEMAGTWLFTGAAMIVALLVVCMLLPRRNPEYSLAPPMNWATSASDEQSEPEKSEQQDQQSSSTGFEDTNQKDASNPFQEGENYQQGKSETHGGDGKPTDESGDQPSGKSKSSGSKGKESDKKEEDPSDEQKEKQAPQKDGRTQDNQSGQSKQKSDQQRGDQVAKSSQPKQTQPPPPQPKMDPAKIAKNMLGWVGGLMRLLYWLVAFAIAGYFGWKYRKEIQEALANFWKSLQDFLDSLLGRKRTRVAETESTEAVPAVEAKSFGEFHDPFLTGMAQGRPPIEVIRYSFEALEAWAREHGIPRLPEQTPQEFAQVVASHENRVAREAGILAELYNRCAYGGDLGARKNLEPLRNLWQHMAARAAAN